MDFPVKSVEQLRDHLRSLRRKAGLTQKELGVRLGLGQVRIASIEASPGSVSSEQLLQILQTLGAEMVIRTKWNEKTEREAALERTLKVPATPVAPSNVSDELTHVAQGRLRDLMHMSSDKAQAVMQLLKWRGNPSDDDQNDDDFPRTEPVVLDAQGAREIDYWRQNLNVDKETFIKALRAVGVVLVHDTPSRNAGSW
jgi:transcriptional regulator with XRE-family HTH domain